MSPTILPTKLCVSFPTYQSFNSISSSFPNFTSISFSLALHTLTPFFSGMFQFYTRWFVFILTDHAFLTQMSCTHHSGWNFIFKDICYSWLKTYPNQQIIIYLLNTHLHEPHKLILHRYTRITSTNMCSEPKWIPSGCLWIFPFLRFFSHYSMCGGWVCVGVLGIWTQIPIPAQEVLFDLSHWAIFPAQLPLKSCSTYFVHVVYDDCNSHWLLVWSTLKSYSLFLVPYPFES